MNIEKIIKEVLKNNGGIPFKFFDGVGGAIGTSKEGFIKDILEGYRNLGQDSLTLTTLQLYMSENLPLGTYMLFNNFEKNISYVEINIDFYIKRDWVCFKYTYFESDEPYFEIKKIVYPNFRK